MDEINWVVKYLESSWWDVGGCWGLYQRCVKERLNVELPDYPHLSIKDMKALVKLVKENQTDPLWIERTVDQAKLGDCVVMSSIKGVFNHVGFYLGNRQVLHSTYKSNTGVSKLGQLDLQGYKEFKIYSHVSFNTHS